MDSKWAASSGWTQEVPTLGNSVALPKQTGPFWIPLFETEQYHGVRNTSNAHATVLSRMCVSWRREFVLKAALMLLKIFFTRNRDDYQRLSVFFIEDCVDVEKVRPSTWQTHTDHCSKQGIRYNARSLAVIRHLTTCISPWNTFGTPHRILWITSLWPTCLFNLNKKTPPFNASA